LNRCTAYSLVQLLSSSFSWRHSFTAGPTKRGLTRHLPPLPHTYALEERGDPWRTALLRCVHSFNISLRRPASCFFLGPDLTPHTTTHHTHAVVTYPYTTTRYTPLLPHYPYHTCWFVGLVWTGTVAPPHRVDTTAIVTGAWFDLSPHTCPGLDGWIRVPHYHTPTPWWRPRIFYLLVEQNGDIVVGHTHTTCLCLSCPSRRRLRSWRRGREPTPPLPLTGSLASSSPSQRDVVASRPRDSGLTPYTPHFLLAFVPLFRPHPHPALPHIAPPPRLV